MFNDPIMSIINKNLSYKYRQEVISIISESSEAKAKAYGNIANFFYKRFEKMKIGNALKEYTSSKGSILSFKGYKNMVDCLALLKMQNNPAISKAAIVIEQAVLNLKANQRSFEVAFKTSSDLGKFVYCTILKACMASTSLLISHIDDGAYKQSSYYDFSSHIAITSLEKFNEACKTNVISKALRIDNNLGNRAVKEGFLDDIVGAGITVASSFITYIRSLVYWVYYTRIDLAEYLEQQAAYLEMNKIAIQNNRPDLTQKEKQKIIDEQTKWQKRLLELSDTIQVDDIKAARKAQEEAKKDIKEMKVSDITTSSNSQNEDNQSSGEEMPDFF